MNLAVAAALLTTAMTVSAQPRALTFASLAEGQTAARIPRRRGLSQ